MARTLSGLVLVVYVMSTVALTARIAPADFTGTWTGTIAVPEKGKPGARTPLHAAFKHAGAALTGTIGPDADAQAEISNGRVETTQYGTVISFDLVGESFMMRFELRPADGVLRGVARLDGAKAVAPVELQPAK
jgi:hypothetical protein